jgi:hypothetical protein
MYLMEEPFVARSDSEAGRMMFVAGDPHQSPPALKPETLSRALHVEPHRTTFSVAACWIPAVRAGRTEPMDAFRME